MKKILRSLLVFLLCIIININCVQASAYANDSIIERYLCEFFLMLDEQVASIKNEVSSNLYFEVVKNISNSNCADLFGGAYINQDDELVINVCDSSMLSYCKSILSNDKKFTELEKYINSNDTIIDNIISFLNVKSDYVAKKLKKYILDNTYFIEEHIASLKDSYNVNYEITDYSISHLEYVKDLLEQEASTFGIWLLTVDEKNNNIMLYVNDINMYDNIISYLLSIDETINSDILCISEVENNMTPTATYQAYGGRKMSSSEYVWTVGFNACDNNGNYGVVSCGHSATVGTKVYNEDGKKIGTITKNSFKNGIDASFTKFDDSLFIKWKSTYYVSEKESSIYSYISDVATESQYISGARVERYGLVTGKTVGRIIYPSVSITDNDTGITFKNMVVYDTIPIEGDSGGPVILSSGSAKCKRYIAAVNSLRATLGDGTVVGMGSKAYDILNNFNLTAVTN